MCARRLSRRQHTEHARGCDDLRSLGASRLPAHPALYFAPPAETPWLPRRDRLSRRPRKSVVRGGDPGEHPVIRGVDPVTLRIDRARNCSSADLTPIARSSRARRSCVSTSLPIAAPSSLVSARRTRTWPTRRPFRCSWPTRSSGWHGPRCATCHSARVWRPFPCRPDHARRRRISSADPDDRCRISAVLTAPGLYRVESAGARNTIAVNAADPQRSNVAATTPGAGTSAAPPREPARAAMVARLRGGRVRPRVRRMVDVAAPGDGVTRW